MSERTAGQGAIVDRCLAGKAALVTGASRGIGAEIARQLAAEGARVALHYGGSEPRPRRLPAN